MHYLLVLHYYRLNLPPILIIKIISYDAMLIVKNKKIDDNTKDAKSSLNQHILMDYLAICHFLCFQLSQL